MSNPQTIEPHTTMPEVRSSSDRFSAGGKDTVHDRKSPPPTQSIDRKLQARGTRRKYLRRGVRSPRMLESNVKKLLVAIQSEEEHTVSSPYGSHRRTSFQKRVRVKQSKR